MITGEEVMDIRVFHRQGMSIRAISRELKMSRKTVRKYLRNPDLQPTYRTRVPRLSKLDPFKAYLLRRIGEAKPRRLPATVFLREIQAQGYDGGITTLKNWLNQQYCSQPAPAVVRFETPPGKQAQVDWTSVRRGKDKLSAFVGTLGHSRFSFVWFTNSEKFDAMVEGHERFFDAISGVPWSILYDNMKTVIIDRNAYGAGHHRFHAGFREFAKHHGFSPQMCAPYRAQTKGKVERFNRYLKESFVWPLESRLKAEGVILDADLANAHVGTWLRDIANVRIHAETKERPLDGLIREAPHLLPRGPAWTGIAPSIPTNLRTLHVPQHDLAVYDAIGGVA